LRFSVSVVGILIYNQPPYTRRNVFHSFLVLYTTRIDVKANTTIAVRRSESNDIPGGDLGKMIDGTCESRLLLYISIIYYIYITTIIRAPDVINNDFACRPPSGCFLFFRLMDVKSTNLRKRWAVTFRHLHCIHYIASLKL